MFLINSRLGLFTAAYLRRHSFLRTYGVNLPSSLTRVLSRTLGYSPRLPVSVISTESLDVISRRAFLGIVTSNAHIAQGVCTPTKVRPVFQKGNPDGAEGLHVVPPFWSYASSVSTSKDGQEYEPAIHRLRPSASS